MTLLELLESLEAAVAARQAGTEGNATAPSALLRQERNSGEVHWAFPNENANVLPPDFLRSQMERAGLTETEFSSIFGVARELVRDWVEGARPVPAWVLPTVQMLYLLSPAVRQRLLGSMHVQTEVRKPETQPKQIKSHPFSRIEDL